MDQLLAAQVFVYALWALAVIIFLLIAYWIIRLAVTHSLRSHHYWLQRNGRG
jgi:hypothetical protein